MASARPADKQYVFHINGREVICRVVVTEAEQQECDTGPTHIYQLLDLEKISEEYRHLFRSTEELSAFNENIKQNFVRIENLKDSIRIQLEIQHRLNVVYNKKNQHAIVDMAKSFLKKYLTSGYFIDTYSAEYLDFIITLSSESKTLHSINQEAAEKLFANINRSLPQESQAPKTLRENIELCFTEMFLPKLRLTEDYVFNLLTRNLMKDRNSPIGSNKRLRYEVKASDAKILAVFAKRFGVLIKNEVLQALSNKTEEQTHVFIRINYLQHKLFQYIDDKKLGDIPPLPTENTYAFKTIHRTQIVLISLELDMDKKDILNINNKTAGLTSLEIIYTPVDNTAHLRFKTFLDAVNYLDIFHKLYLARTHKAWTGQITMDHDPESPYNAYGAVIQMPYADYQILKQDRLLPLLQGSEEKEIVSEKETLESHLKKVSRLHPQMNFYSRYPFKFAENSNQRTEQSPTSDIEDPRFHEEKTRLNQ